MKINLPSLWIFATITNFYLLENTHGLEVKDTVESHRLNRSSYQHISQQKIPQVGISNFSSSSNPSNSTSYTEKNKRTSNDSGFVSIKVNATAELNSSESHKQSGNKSCTIIKHRIINCKTSSIIQYILNSTLNSEFFDESRESNGSFKSNLGTNQLIFPSSVLKNLEDSRAVPSIRAKVNAIANSVARSVIKVDPSGYVRVNVTNLQDKIFAVYSDSNTVAEAQALARVVKTTVSESHTINTCTAVIKAFNIGKELADLILRVMFGNNAPNNATIIQSNLQRQIYLRTVLVDTLRTQIDSGVHHSQNDFRNLICNIISNLGIQIPTDFLNTIITTVLAKYDPNHIRIESLLNEILTAVNQILLNQVYCMRLAQHKLGLSELGQALLNGLRNHKQNLTSMAYIKNFIAITVPKVVSRTHGNVSADIRRQITDAVGKIIDQYNLLSIRSSFSEIVTKIKIDVEHILPEAQARTNVDSSELQPSSEETLIVATTEETSNANTYHVTNSSETGYTSSTKVPKNSNVSYLPFYISAANMAGNESFNLKNLEKAVETIINNEIKTRGLKNLDIPLLESKILDLISGIKAVINIVVLDYTKVNPIIVNIHHKRSI